MRKEVIDQTQQKENNLSIVLRELMTDRDCTRVKLASRTGLAQATVTKIITQLMGWGIVTEQETIGTGVGRRAVRLHLRGEKFQVAALRLNRDNICGALVDMNRQAGHFTRCTIRFEEGVENSLEKLKDMVRQLIAAAPEGICAIGVAVPGPFSYRTGRLSLMSGFPGWEKVDIRQELEDAFDIPIFVEHDANCGAVAEFWNTDRSKEPNLLFVAADMGIGAGMILDSQLYRGKDGFAGEIGHASICFDGPLCECGNRGCLELYASTKALERRYAQHTGCQEADAARILALVRQKDATATAAYTETVRALAYGLVSITNIINPDVLVFAGRLTEGGGLFSETLWEVFRQRLMPEQIRRMRLEISKQKVDPMLLGAGIGAFTNMLEMPTKYFATNTNQLSGGTTNG